jgi:hypothetical protein
MKEKTCRACARARQFTLHQHNARRDGRETARTRKGISPHEAARTRKGRISLPHLGVDASHGLGNMVDEPNRLLRNACEDMVGHVGRVLAHHGRVAWHHRAGTRRHRDARLGEGDKEAILRPRFDRFLKHLDVLFFVPVVIPV